MSVSEAASEVAAISPVPEPAMALRRCADLPHALLLDSALRHPTLGHYFFLAVDPFHFLAVPATGKCARWRALEARDHENTKEDT